MKEGIVRTFGWWFGMGALMTISVLMLQGGVHTLFFRPMTGGSPSSIAGVGSTILGGGLFAGCLALVLNRVR
jgi:hypothetical protein